MELYDPHRVTRLALLVEETYAPVIAWAVRQGVHFPCGHLMYPIDFYTRRPDKLWVPAPVAIFTLLYPAGSLYELDASWFEGIYLLTRDQWPQRLFNLDVVKAISGLDTSLAYRGRLKDLVGVVIDRASWLYDRRRPGALSASELERLVRQALQL
ncbi:MAG: hypothetical protein HZC41_03340 [Chloroflexi bacterium]|nr:hypothetical protein [Chloroflexota bacterium]